MTLARSVGGTDVDRNGTADLSGAGVTYFGHSFGGIYGTMLAGVDRDIARSALSVPGGPVSEIVRLGAFRGLNTLQLQAAGLLNSTDHDAPSSSSSCHSRATARSSPPCLARWRSRTSSAK
jgi:hypothetical protein